MIADKTITKIIKNLKKWSKCILFWMIFDFSSEKQNLIWYYEKSKYLSIRTTFFDIPVTSGVDANGNPTYDLDFSNIGSGRQKIKYVGILGY
jgi:hypothetical protein